MTLGEIIEAVRSGKRPEYESLRYAICALDALSTFDSSALRKLAKAEREKKKPALVWSAEFQAEENFRRWKKALETDPKAWIGWSNDPDNPDFIERRRSHIRFAEKIISKVET